MASLYVQVMGLIIGIITLLMLAFKVPGLPFGKTLSTLIGAVLMIVFGIVSTNQAYASINGETLTLLFGTMLMSVLLESEGFFRVLLRFLLWRCHSATDLLIRTCLLSAVMSALVTNDLVCVVFTPFVVNLCERHDLAHAPFLIALATSANIGSAATAVGNPQNILIAALSGISYFTFVINLLGPTLVALAMNSFFLCAFYRSDLMGKSVKTCNALFVRAPEIEESRARHKEKVQENGTELVSYKAEQRQSNNQAEFEMPMKPDTSNSVSIPITDETVKNANGNGVTAAVHDSVASHLSSSISNTSRSLTSRAIKESAGEQSHEFTKQSASSSSHENHNDHSPSSPFQRSLPPSKESSLASSAAQSADSLYVPAVSRIRVADREHPRQLGRRLIMQEPPVAASIARRAARQKERDDSETAPSKFASRFHAIKLPPWFRLLLMILVFLGVIASFIGGLELGFTALGGAVLMLIIDWRDPDENILKVDWSLLVFFAALFIVTAGINATGIPAEVIADIQGAIDVSTARGIAIYSIVIVIGSNTVSNVPLVLLFAPSIPNFSNPKVAWLLLAFVSTVAGNLTILGSVANIIVVARSKAYYSLTFSEYLRFGFFTTIIITAIGAILVKLVTSSS